MPIGSAMSILIRTFFRNFQRIQITFRKKFDHFSFFHPKIIVFSLQAIRLPSMRRTTVTHLNCIFRFDLALKPSRFNIGAESDALIWFGIEMFDDR